MCRLVPFLLVSAAIFVATSGASAETLRVCAQAGEACTHISLARALRQAKDGMTIVIEPGTYGDAGTLTASRVTIQATGARVEGEANQNKAALVITGRDTTIIGLECSQVAVPDGNGACIRQEGANLTLRNVNFHHNQVAVMAMAGSGRVVIEDSVIESNGNKGAPNLYAAGASLELRRTKVLHASGEAHEVKSLAARTTIEDCVIASLDAVDSRLIDLPSGGEVTIRNSVLQKGKKNANPDVIGFGLPGATHKTNALTLVGNTIIIDNPKGARLVHTGTNPPQVTMTGNTVIGGKKPEGDDSTWFPDRQAAGYPAFPLLKK